MRNDTRSDFERILMNITVQTSGSPFDMMVRLDSGWDLRERFGRFVPQFMPIQMAAVINMPLQSGDIVRCQTNPHHHWGVSIFVRSFGPSNFILRELGGSAELNMYNEDFYVLRFMPEYLLYSGHQHKIYTWIMTKAFSKTYNDQAELMKKPGGVEFDGDKVTFWSRSHIFAMEKRADDGSTLYAQPKQFEMLWSKKTRLKDIIATMQEQGFSEPFKFTHAKSPAGYGGCLSFTRENFEGMIK